MNRLSTVSNDDDDDDDVIVVVSSLVAIIVILSEGLFLNEEEEDAPIVEIPDFNFAVAGDGLYNSSYSCKWSEIKSDRNCSLDVGPNASMTRHASDSVDITMGDGGGGKSFRVVVVVIVVVVISCCCCG